MTKDGSPSERHLPICDPAFQKQAWVAHSHTWWVCTCSFWQKTTKLPWIIKLFAMYNRQRVHCARSEASIDTKGFYVCKASTISCVWEICLISQWWSPCLHLDDHAAKLQPENLDTIIQIVIFYNKIKTSIASALLNSIYTLIWSCAWIQTC